MKKLKN